MATDNYLKYFRLFDSSAPVSWKERKIAEIFFSGLDKSLKLAFKQSETSRARKTTTMDFL